MWPIINKEVGNSIHHDYKLDLRNGNEIIYIPQNFFLERAEFLFC